MYREDVCTFALSRIFQFDPHIPKAIVATFGGCAPLFQQDRNTLIEVLGPYSKYREALQNLDLNKEERILDRALGSGVRYLIHNDRHFPELLSQCEDAPIGLFVRSDDSFDNVFGSSCVSVVGTRDMSSYGERECRRIVETLAYSQTRPTIVSGLALGIDITAHRTALENGLPTIAVLGTGIDTIYPAAHANWANQIIHTPRCAVISEYAPGTDIRKISFLGRNRIIAGLSGATVLVESRIKGGGMTTARLALSYNRSVYAVPGRSDDVRSQGCNVLIHSMIAESVISPEEFFKSMGLGRLTSSRGKKRVSVEQFYGGGVDKIQLDIFSRIVRLVRNERDISVTDISHRLGIGMGPALSATARLEADGFIKIDVLQRCSAAF